MARIKKTTSTIFMYELQSKISIKIVEFDQKQILQSFNLMSFGFPEKDPKKNMISIDTSKYTKTITNQVERSNFLWNQDDFQDSQSHLFNAIKTFEYVIKNTNNQKLKQQYIQQYTSLITRFQARKKQIQGGKKQSIFLLSAIKQGGNKQDDKLKGTINDAIVSDKPNVKWEDIAGLQGAKQSLKQAVILPIQFPQIFKGARKPWKGILLYGPPGTGKTYLAKACATQANGTFFSVSSSDLMSKYVGQSQKLIKNLFQMARQKKPSIIFIDQIDSMCGNRSDNQNDSSKRVKTEFLVQMQGVGHNDQGVLVLGATNLPWALDPAIRRRFQRRIYISLPQTHARTYLLQNGMRETPNNLNKNDYIQLGQKSQGYSGSDLAVLIKNAAYQPLRILQNAKRWRKINDGRMAPVLDNYQGPDVIESTLAKIDRKNLFVPPVTINDFRKALQKVKPSVDNKQLGQYVEFTQAFGQDG